jgi:RimJ/RimL family protein N-acetyltransferase
MARASSEKGSAALNPTHLRSRDMTMIQTLRLILRELTDEDREALLVMYQDRG